MNLMLMSVLLVTVTGLCDASTLSPPLQQLFTRHHSLSPSFSSSTSSSSSFSSAGLQDAQGHPRVLALRCQRENETVPNWLDPTCLSYLACSDSHLIVQVCQMGWTYSYPHRSCVPAAQMNCSAQHEELSTKVRNFLDPFVHQSLLRARFAATVRPSGDSNVYVVQNPGDVNADVNVDISTAGGFHVDVNTGNSLQVDVNKVDFHTNVTNADVDSDVSSSTNNAEFNAADSDTPNVQQEVDGNREKEVEGRTIDLSNLPFVVVNSPNSLDVTLDKDTCQCLDSHLQDLETAINSALLLLTGCSQQACNVTLFRLHCTATK